MFLLAILLFILGISSIILKKLQISYFEKVASWRNCLIFCIILLFLGTIYIQQFKNEDKGNAVRPRPILRQNSKNIAAPLKSESPTFKHDITIHDKWIVVTSISQPTPQVEKLSQIAGFKLVIVADMKTPLNWTFSNPDTVFLSTETQLQLGYKVLKYLPWNSYTRKVIGYLYAIEHGAQVIYDTDDDNAPDDLAHFANHFAFHAKSITRGLLVTSPNHTELDHNLLKNPYAHFGQTSVWPRGYPLEHIGLPHSNVYTLCSNLSTPLIQQGLVNGDPDVDAIFRLSRKKYYSPLEITFDTFAPPAIYPPGIFAPFNSQNTVFLYNALWSLLLPTTVAFRVTDIWRGYWAQRLLWELDSHLGFYSPHTIQLRNAHNYLKDFAEEDQIYKQTGHLVKLLSEWECPQKDSFFGCIVALTEHMAGNEMWGFEEVSLVQAWLEDLKSVGYKEPERGQQWKRNTNSSKIPSQGTLAIFNGVDTTVNVREDSVVKLTSFCNFTVPPASLNSSANDTNNMRHAAPFASTLLIVTFNIPHYSNIPLLDYIYRPFYPNILYCGDLKSAKELENITSPISFVHAPISNGYFAYDCALKAIEMSYSSGITSYFVLSDDILLNFWNFEKQEVINILDPDEMWAYRDHFTDIDTAVPYNSTVWGGWGWWRGPYGLNATIQALQAIYSSDDANVEKYRKNRAEFGINETAGTYGESDIFQLPTSKQEIFYAVGNILLESKVFLEIAVPFLVNGISPRERVGNMSGLILWGGQRDTALDQFKDETILIHPLKLSAVVSDAGIRGKYCDKYVRRVLNSY